MFFLLIKEISGKNKKGSNYVWLHRLLKVGLVGSGIREILRYPDMDLYLADL